MLPTPLAPRTAPTIQRPSGEARGRIHGTVAIDVTPDEASQRWMLPVVPRKNSRLGTEAHTAIVIPAVEYTSLPSLTRRIWSGADSPAPPTWNVWKYAM